MNRKDISKTLLKDAIDSIRASQPDPELVRESEARLWARDGAASVVPGAVSGSIHGCSDVRAMLDDYRNHKLAVPRALLVEAHLHECVTCSRYFEHAAAPIAWQSAKPLAATRALPWKLYAVAATILIAIGAGVLFNQSELILRPPGPRATVEAFDGGLYLPKARLSALSMGGMLFYAWWMVLASRQTSVRNSRSARGAKIRPSIWNAAISSFRPPSAPVDIFMSSPRIAGSR